MFVDIEPGVEAAVGANAMQRRVHVADAWTSQLGIHGGGPVRCQVEVQGADTIQLAYAAVGRGWLWAPTRWPLLRPVSDAAYRWLARHRYQISAHLEPLLNRLEQRRAQARMNRMQRCHDGHCEM